MDVSTILCEKLNSIYEQFELLGGAQSLAPIRKGETYLLSTKEHVERERKRWIELAIHIIETGHNLPSNIEYMAIQMDAEEVLIKILHI